ncbi:hypothetical protein H8959_011250 [Pygathrix nigripes]
MLRDPCPRPPYRAPAAGAQPKDSAAHTSAPLHRPDLLSHPVSISSSHLLCIPDASLHLITYFSVLFSLSTCFREGRGVGECTVGAAPRAPGARTPRCLELPGSALPRPAGRPVPPRSPPPRPPPPRHPAIAWETVTSSSIHLSCGAPPRKRAGGQRREVTLPLQVMRPSTHGLDRELRGAVLPRSGRSLSSDRGIQVQTLEVASGYPKAPERRRLAGWPGYHVS